MSDSTTTEIPDVISMPDAIDEMVEEREGINHVIAASAGTGKTYTLEHLVLQKVLDGVPIDAILVLTFTRRAAGEMRMRIRGLLTKTLTELADEDQAEVFRERLEAALNGFDGATISTIHSFCQAVISDHAFSSGQLFQTGRIDAKEVFEECFYDLLRDTLAVEEPYRSWLQEGLEGKVKLGQLIKDLEKIFSSDAKILPDVGDNPLDHYRVDKMDSPEDWQVRTVLWRLIAPLMKERVREALIAGEQTTYDDLIESVEEGVEKGRLRDVLRERYQVAMVDEFQDTSPAQWAIFKEIFLDDEERELYVIGDEKQAIYSFRGADLDTYRRAIENDGFGEVEPVNLERNFRSTNALIDAYNKIFEGAYFDGDYIPVQPPPAAKEVHRPVFEDAGRLDALGKEPISLVHLLNKSDDRAYKRVGKPKKVYLHWVADKIQELLRSPREERYLCDGSDGDPEHLEAGDIYVLTRTNSDADAMGELLAARGIPFGFYRKSGLFQSDEARQIIRLLKAIARPSDRSLRRKAMLTPFFEIRLDEILDYDEAEEESNSARKKLQNWGEAARRRDYAALFDGIMSQSGVIRRALFTRDGERRLTNYQHLFEWLRQEAASGNLGVEQMAELLHRRREGDLSGDEEEGADLQRQESDGSSVQIMTMHKAKGLSAEVVFVCGGFGKRDDESGGSRSMKIFASNQLEFSDETLAFHKEAKGDLADGVFEQFADQAQSESKRLLYVAITRAKSKVFVPYIEDDITYSWWGKSSLRFVFESLEDIAGGEGLPELESLSGFERDYVEMTEVDISPEPPTLIESFEDVEIADRDRWEALKRKSRFPGDIHFKNLREERVRVTTSYTGMSGESMDRGQAIEPEHADPLPKSKNAGTALHEILEFLDYGTALEADDWESWLKVSSGDESVGELIAHHLEEQGFDPEVFTHYTAEILFDALRAPLMIDGGALPSSAELDGANEGGPATAREVSFLVPIPQAPERTLGAVSPPDIKVDKGYFTGEIDLIFERDGRVYIADWKSDTRVGGESYDREILREHVEKHYRKQVAVYTTALMRMLGIEDEETYEERFGGFFYLFVRGMNKASDEGQFFERLSWEEAQALHQRFIDSEATPADAIEAWAPTDEGKKA